MLPSSGPISLAQVPFELALQGNMPINHSRCYETVGKSQNTQISMSDFRINNNWYSRASILKGSLGSTSVCAHNGYLYYGLHKFDSDHRWIKSGSLVTNGATPGLALGTFIDMHSDGTSLFVLSVVSNGNKALLTQIDSDFNVVAHVYVMYYNWGVFSSRRILKAWSDGSGICAYLGYSHNTSTSPYYYGSSIVFVHNNVFVYAKYIQQSWAFWYYRQDFCVAKTGSFGGQLYALRRMNTAYSGCTNASVLVTYDLTAATLVSAVKFYLPQTVAGRTSTLRSIKTFDLNGALYGVATCHYIAGSFGGVAYPHEYAQIVFRFENNAIVWQKAFDFNYPTSYSYAYAYADIISFSDSICVACADTAGIIYVTRIASDGTVMWFKKILHTVTTAYYNVITDMAYDPVTDKVSINIGTGGHMSLPADGVVSGLDVTFNVAETPPVYAAGMALTAEPDYNTWTLVNQTYQTVTAVYIEPNTKLTNGTAPAVTRSNV